jgi:hypothetical protein
MLCRILFQILYLAGPIVSRGPRGSHADESSEARPEERDPGTSRESPVADSFASQNAVHRASPAWSPVVILSARFRASRAWIHRLIRGSEGMGGSQALRARGAPTG